MNRFQRTVSTVLGIGMIAVGGVHAARPESRWHRVGKSAHAKARMKNAKARNSYCSNACKKAGARKPSDLGACKESCVFG